MVSTHGIGSPIAAPVHVGVCGGVRRRGSVTLDEGAVQVGDHHGVRGEFVVAHAGRFDHQQIGVGDPGRDVPGGPDDQFVAGELGV